MIVLIILIVYFGIGAIAAHQVGRIVYTWASDHQSSYSSGPDSFGTTLGILGGLLLWPIVWPVAVILQRVVGQVEKPKPEATDDTDKLTSETLAQWMRRKRKAV